jgi:hypothetical protein
VTSQDFQRELESSPFHPMTVGVESWVLTVQEIDTGSFPSRRHFGSSYSSFVVNKTIVRCRRKGMEEGIVGHSNDDGLYYCRILTK